MQENHIPSAKLFGLEPLHQVITRWLGIVPGIDAPECNRLPQDPGTHEIHSPELARRWSIEPDAKPEDPLKALDRPSDVFVHGHGGEGQGILVRVGMVPKGVPLGPDPLDDLW